MQPDLVVDGINHKDNIVRQWVYDTYFPETLNVVKKITRGSPYSEDLTKEVFLVLMEQPGTFETLSQISQFLNTTARNLSTHHNTDRDVEKRHADGLYEHYMNIEDQNIKNAESDNYFKRLMCEEIEKLPRVARYVFKLSYLEGLKNGQIARKLGISKRTVETHKSYGYKFLRIEVKKSGRYFIFTLSFIV
jgi:RNA polymerase sigma-70 factor, ECF subfamily